MEAAIREEVEDGVISGFMGNIFETDCFTEMKREVLEIINSTKENLIMFGTINSLMLESEEIIQALVNLIGRIDNLNGIKILIQKSPLNNEKMMNKLKFCFSSNIVKEREETKLPFNFFVCNEKDQFGCKLITLNNVNTEMKLNRFIQDEETEMPLLLNSPFIIGEDQIIANSFRERFNYVW